MTSSSTPRASPRRPLDCVPHAAGLGRRPSRAFQSLSDGGGPFHERHLRHRTSGADSGGGANASRSRLPARIAGSRGVPASSPLRRPRPRSLLAPAGRSAAIVSRAPSSPRRPGRLGRGAAGPAALPRGPRLVGPGRHLLRRLRRQQRGSEPMSWLATATKAEMLPIRSTVWAARASRYASVSAPRGTVMTSSRRASMGDRSSPNGPSNQGQADLGGRFGTAIGGDLTDGARVATLWRHRPGGPARRSGPRCGPARSSARLVRGAAADGRAVDGRHPGSTGR